MDVREKLVELLSEKCMETCKQRKGYVCSVEECKRSKEKCCGFYADHLISNGVTVLPVQVGDTVYGRFLPYGEGVQQCEVVKSKLCQFKDRTVRYLLDLEFDIIDPYFNDGRLMRCSTQAVYGADFGNWYRVYLTREEAESTPPKGE